MRMSWKIGRVAGIDLFLHPTFLFFLAFIGLSQGGGPGTILLTTAIFGCVLLHELGHALMARRFGILTADITLYPIGGVARLQHLPRSPGAELLIALAGPAVNVAIALVLGVGLAALVGAPHRLGWRDGIVGWTSLLMGANLLLAGFNLIPAFPMDGGRVLRALLSIWLGRGRATEIAAVVGRVLAVGFGLGSLMYTPWPLKLLHVFLAAFIFFAAGMERTQVRVEERRRRFAEPDDGIRMAPPGFYWVNRGNGFWQLAPIAVRVADPSGSWR